MNDIKDCNLIVDEVLSLLNSEAFQSLRSYYDDTTIFNVMGVERSENRHSSFLRWLFSTNSSHGLGDKPLRLFLRLIATQKWGRQIFKEELFDKVMAGTYHLELLESVETEKYIGNIKNSSKNNLWAAVQSEIIITTMS